MTEPSTPAESPRPADDSSTDPDIDLVRQAQAGKPGAFSALFEKYWPRVLPTAYSWFRNVAEAEDAAIEAVEDAFGSIGRFRGRSRFSTWFFRVVMRRLAYNKRRSRHKPEALPLDSCAEVADPGLSPEERHERSRLIGLLLEAVDSLPEGLAQAMRLCYFSELDQDEAAQALGIRPDALRRRLSLGRQMLRRKLRKELA
jgi:RNA polymerase sigma-70 factor (ECF subfamily)